MGCMEIILMLIQILNSWESRNMAELKLYKCRQCGWIIEAPSEGADVLMDGGMVYFICNECNQVYCRTFEFGYENEINKKCPRCNSHDTTNWKPGKICPECGGELEDLGVSCWED